MLNRLLTDTELKSSSHAPRRNARTIRVIRPASDSDPVTGGYDGTTFTRSKPTDVSFRGE